MDSDQLPSCTQWRSRWFYWSLSIGLVLVTFNWLRWGEWYVAILTSLSGFIFGFWPYSHQETTEYGYWLGRADEQKRRSNGF
jgi:hypothetical protein